jgi:outer membrane receptor protein involved in Fe transport
MTRITRGKRCTGWAAGAATLLVGATGPGQAGAQGRLDADDALVEEITVTARRKEESLLDVPLAVSAFSEEAILEAGFTEFDDIFLLAPGVFNSTSGGRSDRVTIRGHSQVSTTGGSNAGIFIDGVYVSGPVSALEIQNLERVEIVKGPQAVQFGRGTLAGAVNYVTMRPDREEVQARVQGTVADLGEQWLFARVSMPVTDTLAVAVAGRSASKDSEFFNSFEGREDLGGEESLSGELGVLFTPTDTFQAYWRTSYIDIEDDAIGIYTQGPEFNNCILNTTRQYYCGEIEIDYDNIRNITRDPQFVDGEAGIDREVFRTALILDWTLGAGQTLQSITGYNDENERWGSDATNRGVTASQLLPDGPAVDISREWSDFSQELRYTTSLGESAELLVGYYYFESERDEVATYIPEDRGTLTETNNALFASLSYRVTDRLTVTPELRWQEDDIELDNPAGNLFVEASFDAVLPRLTVDYQMTDDMMIYGVYAEGNKPGSVNTRLLAALDPALIPIDEEENEMFEIGAKGRLLDGRLQYQAALYTIDWTNQQLTQQCDPPQCAQSVTYTDNIGETQVNGLELDLAAVLIPDFWDARLTVGWADAEIEFLEVVGSASVVQEALALGFPPNAAGNGAIVSGTPAPASPEWTYSVSTTLSRQLGTTGFDWFARADYTWIDEQFASVYGQASTGDRTNLNMRVGVENANWRIEAWATNLTDDDTPLALVRTVRFDGTLNPFDPIPSPVQRAFSAIIPEGRQYGLTVTYDF